MMSITSLSFSVRKYITRSTRRIPQPTISLPVPLTQRQRSTTWGSVLLMSHHLYSLHQTVQHLSSVRYLTTMITSISFLPHFVVTVPPSLPQAINGVGSLPFLVHG